MTIPGVESAALGNSEGNESEPTELHGVGVRCWLTTMLRPGAPADRQNAVISPQAAQQRTGTKIAEIPIRRCIGGLTAVSQCVV